MRPTLALVHRENLLFNLAALRRLVPPGTALCPAVKANAYGHGALEVAGLLGSAGIEAVCVATVDEGAQLRAAGFDRPILLLGTIQPDEIQGAIDADLDVFVWTREAVEALAQGARGRTTPLRVHLKVDTGMGRVGCRPDEAEGLAEAIVHAMPLEFTGICTHLAAADAPGPLGVPEQLARFDQAVEAVRARGWNPRFVHAANSGGVVGWPTTHFNLARPGIALYGYPPATPEPFRPVMELVSRVGFVKTVPPGTCLSYGSKYVTDRVTDVVTVPIGYADGYRRAFTNRAPVWIADRLFPVSGTVCMDQILVDVGPDSGIKAGDPVVLFGPPGAHRSVQPPTVADLAAIADTITYELLCGISARVPRRYV